MKKITITLILLIEMASGLYAQIPNGGFENWTTDVDNNENPTGWLTTNNLPYTNVSKYTPAYAGSYSMQVEPLNAGIAIVPGFAMITFPYTLRPTKIRACIKTTVMSGDAVSIITALQKGDSVIAAGGSSTYFIDSTITQFTCFSFPIYYQSQLTPDSATITVIAGKSGSVQAGTKIIVDQLSFDFSTSVDEFTTIELASLEQNIPNPAITSTYFPLLLKNGSEINLHLFDLLGQEVKSTSLGFLEAGHHNIPISVNDLPTGAYNCYITGKDFTLSKKIMIMEH